MIRFHHLLPVIATVLALGYLPTAAADAISDMQAKMRACDSTAGTAAEHHACILKATPIKCRSYVLGGHGKFYSPLVQKQWFVCLRTCDSESADARTQGDCSTRTR